MSVHSLLAWGVWSFPDSMESLIIPWWHEESDHFMMALRVRSFPDSMKSLIIPWWHKESDHSLMAQSVWSFPDGMKSLIIPNPISIFWEDQKWRQKFTFLRSLFLFCTQWQCILDIYLDSLTFNSQFSFKVFNDIALQRNQALKCTTIRSLKTEMKYMRWQLMERFWSPEPILMK